MKQKKLIVTILVLVILAAVGITIALLTCPDNAENAATPANATVSDAADVEATTPAETPVVEDVVEPATQDTAAE